MSPSTLLDWQTAYLEDKHTKLIMQRLISHKLSCILDLLIKTVSIGYRHHLQNGLIGLVGDKLMLFKPTNMNTNYIGLLIVPLPLRR